MISKRKHFLLVFALLLFWSAIAMPSPIPQKTTVVIAYTLTNQTFIFTASEIKKNLLRAGYTVSEADITKLPAIKAEHRIILTVRKTNETTRLMALPDISPLPESASQGYSVRKRITANGTDWYIIGFDAKGLIYGGLDVSETIQLNGFGAVVEIDRRPYITNRGIKFNIPLDSRTPSYSDNGDAALQNIGNMWDINFWHEFLDELARDRYTMLSLWSLSPFPSLVDVPEYPRAALSDVKRTTSRPLPTSDAVYMSTPQSFASLVTVKKISITEKIKFWQQVMQYASDRGIDCYLFTWNLFTYGLENSGYGITDNINNATTRDYVRKATRTLIRTYPLLKGIGLTAGENMIGIPENDKEKFLYDTYGQGINDALEADPHRQFTLIHRAHQAKMSTLKDIFAGLNPRCQLDFSYKYSVAQMYSSVAPKYIYESKFLDEIGDSKFFLTVRDDAWYYLRGGSDAAFTRAYIKNMPVKNLQGFYVGPDGYTWGREYISRSPDSPPQLVVKKRWYSLQLLGRLAYDTSISDAHFTELLHSRFPEANAKKLQDAWASASQVITWVNRFHNQRSQNDYEWYPEACTSFYGFHTIDKFINRAPQNGEGIMSIPAYVEAILNNRPVTGITPVQIAQTLQAISDEAISMLEGTLVPKDKELRSTIDDIKTMAALGKYYSKKILGATNKHLSDKASDPSEKVAYRNAAIKDLQDAALSWKTYADRITASYLPQHLTRMHFTIDFKAIQADVDKEVTQLQNNTPAPGSPEKILQQIQLSFSPISNYYFWHLPKISLPEDWSFYNYIVFELYTTTAQKFDLVLTTDRDTLTKKDISSVPGKWKRIAISLQAFKTQIAKKHTASPVDEKALLGMVSGLGLYIAKPENYPVIELRSITLLKEVSNDVIISP